MTAGTETCGEAAQPRPRNVAEEKFFFLEAASELGLEERRIEDMVVLGRLELGSVSGFLGFLWRICSAVSAAAVGMAS